MNPLRIAVVAACPFPARRGTPIRIQRLSEALAARGHEVHIVTYHLGVPNAGDAGLRGLRVHRIPRVFFYRRAAPGPTYRKLLLVDPLLVRLLRRVLRRFPFDVIHAHHYEGLLAAAVAGRGFPLVYDAHTLLEEELPSYSLGLPRGVAGWAGRHLDALLPPRADHVVAVSEVLRLRLLALGRLPPGAISVVPNGITAESFDPARRRTRRGGPPTVVYAGNLAAYQGIELLLEAFARVRERRRDALLRLVVEPGEDLRGYEGLAGRLGLTDAVSVVSAGFPELPRHLAEADVAVCPRLNCVGVPQKLLNYMAAGLPIVAFQGSASYLEADRTALVVPNGDVQALADAILRLLGDRELAGRLGGAAARHVRSHRSWDAAARAAEEVYARVLAGRSRPEGRAGRP